MLNLGTNFFLGEISDVSFGIAAVLQLALSMDYSIILMNRYRQELKKTHDRKEAMANALRTAFSPAADPEPDTADAPNDITLLVRRFALAFASKIYVQKRVQFERQITLQ